MEEVSVVFEWDFEQVHGQVGIGVHHRHYCKSGYRVLLFGKR